MEFRVVRMCRALEVSRSGYYAWRQRGASLRREQERELVEVLWRIHRQNREAYGTRKAWRALKAEGFECGRHKVDRLRREAGIQTRRRQRFLRRYTARQGAPVAPNRLEWPFSAPGPDEIWVGDFTHVGTRKGWLHLGVLLDLYSRQVVGWSMGRRANAELALAALEMAVQRRRPEPGLIHHTDQGYQYTSGVYQQRLRELGLTASMSRQGNCFDNAVAESFFSSLKNELVYDADFRSIEQARAEVFDYIEAFYNRNRMHQSLGYQTPLQFESQIEVLN